MVKTTVFFTCDKLFGPQKHLMIPGLNSIIYGGSSARKTPGVSLYWSLTFVENIVTVITQDKVIDDNLKRQIKNQTLCTFRFFLLT